MNRREFLKSLGIAAAVIAGSSFLLPEGDGSIIVSSDAQGNFSAGALTQEMIEDACKRAAENCGQPDRLLMSEDAYNDFKKEYYGDGRDGDLTVGRDQVVHLQRDMYFSNLTLRKRSRIVTNGHRIYVSKFLTFGRNSKIGA